MLFEVQNKLVNWVDGMKMSGKHLTQTENYFIDSIRDSVNIHINSYNYGLLPAAPGRNTSGEFNIIQTPTGEVEIEVRSCNAITAGGSRISFNPSAPTDYLRKHLPKENTSPTGSGQKTVLDIAITVNLFRRTPTGIPDMNETPPRLPDAIYPYEISIWPEGYISKEAFGMNSLVIGQIFRQNDIYTIDETYIPASTSMSSHNRLKKYYDTFAYHISSIEKSCRQIGDKVREQSNVGTIARNTNKLCDDILRFIAPVYFGFRNKGRNYSPIDTIEILSSMAHTCFVSIHCLPAREREEMLQYFHEWCDVTPGNFIEIIGQALGLVYDHKNIHNSMIVVTEFLYLLSNLMDKLSNLEYIGQHKENIVVAEKIQHTAADPRKSNWSLLD